MTALALGWARSQLRKSTVTEELVLLPSTHSNWPRVSWSRLLLCDNGQKFSKHGTLDDEILEIAESCGVTHVNSA